MKTSKGAAKGSAKAAPSYPSTEAGMLAALTDYSASNARDAIHTMASARAASPLKGEAFEKAMFSLAREGKISIHHHDLPQSEPESVRASFINNPRNGFAFSAWNVRK